MDHPNAHRRDRILELTTAIGVLAVVTSAAAFVASLPALLPPIGLMLNADYLPTACLAVVGVFGFLFGPSFLAVPRRRYRAAR